GPETKVAREELKRHVAGVMKMVWPAENIGMPALTAFERATGLESFQDQLNKLAPHNDAQRRALAQAQQIANELGQTRWLVIEQEQNPLPFPLFVSFGLFAPSNITAMTVLFLGACAVSAAIYLVIELDRPLEGFIKVSDAPLRNALQHLDQ